MSSESIRSEIATCNNSISALNNEIRALREKIENQNHALKSYLRYRDNLFEELQSRYTNAEAAVGHNLVAVFSVRFESKQGLTFSAKQKAATEAQAQIIEAQIRNNLDTCTTTLAGKEAQMRSLYNQLDQLQINYNQALAQEEADRQAAAAANASGPPKR